jgi:kexin
MSGRIHSLINVYLCLVAILATRILGLEELLEESPYAYRWNHEKYSYYAIGFQDVHVDDVASILGATYIGPIGTLEGYHLFKAYKNDDTVLGQYYRLLRRRSRLSKRAMYVVDAIHHISSQQPKKIYRRGIVPISNLVQQQEKIIQSLDIRDPGYWLQWHLFNSELPGNDINVTGVWQQNITGKGVVVALVDDGIDFTSNDIKDNFFAEGSFDYNDHVKLPMPRTPEDIHGTRCAGEVAAVRNHLCGVGIAYESKVAGIRILSKEISDIDEALSLNYGYQVNDIYSCSWGPPDDGRSLDGPHEIVEKAIINGVQNGRQGKGTIFVFASGNGGAFDDHCNCDGYTNSIYSITVGAIDRYNQHPYYSEACSAVMVVTYSSGSGSFIYTTDRGNDKCTDRHGGTSAAAPLAAGIYALVLSVR